MVPAMPPDGASRPRRRAAPGLTHRPLTPAPRPARERRAVERPSATDLAAAVERQAKVPDVIGTNLDVLFCGINPGRWSGAVGHHFAHPGNRFWKALHLAGFTDRQLAPTQERALLDYGLGITNLVARTTAAAAELEATELRRGAVRLQRKVRRFQPRTVGFLGMGAFRVAFRMPKAPAGRQPELLAGAVVWVLPNPSGLQAAYGMDAVVEHLSALRAFVRDAGKGGSDGAGGSDGTGGSPRSDR